MDKDNCFTVSIASFLPQEPFGNTDSPQGLLAKTCVHCVI